MTASNQYRIPTGVGGLDKILHGGLLPRRAYLIRGGPGAGKTTLGFHFLASNPENSSLYISLGETEQQLRDDVAGVGLSMDRVAVLDMSPTADEAGNHFSLLESWDVEGNAIHDDILDHVHQHQPRRILIDSLSQMRYLSVDSFQFRKQALSLVRTLTAEGATVMFTSEQAPGVDDEALPFLSDGVITLDHTDSARRKERSVIYCFDENASTFFNRCQKVGLPVEDMVTEGTLRFEAIEPLHYNPDQFAAGVREEVEKHGTSMVMLDSLSGYHQSVRGDELQERVHALCRYLTNMGVTVLLVNEIFSIASSQARVTEFGLSYIADNVIMLRYIEWDGELRKTIGVLKKRAGDFERSLREFEINGEGVSIGEPLRGMRGILSGVPQRIIRDDI